MTERAFVALAVTTSFSMLAIVSAVAADDNRGDRGGLETGVLRCSLDGINPAYHPEIFGNPAVAKAYGFVLGTDRVWRVESNCRR